MLCSRKEDRSGSAHALLNSVTSPPPVRWHYPPPQHEADMTLEQRCTDDYRALLSLQQATGHQATTGKNVIKSHKRTSTLPSQQKDAAYYEKRRKNNESAKKSREARQHKEQVIVAHVQILKEENMRLKAEHKLLSRQSGELLARLYNRSSEHKN